MRSLISKVALSLAVVLLAGCAARPVAKGDSLVQQKNTTFPKIGQQVHVVTGGLVHLRADYKSRYGYKLKQPVAIGLALGRVNVTTDDVLYVADLADSQVYCTTRRTYYDPLVGPQTTTCFVEGEKNFFKSIKAAPGEYWFSKELPTPVPFAGSEIAELNNKPVLKRELVFEGQQNNRLFFTEKEYEYSLETPSRAKPVLVKYESLPTKVNVNGAVLSVQAVTSNSLTFSLEKAWD